MRKTAIVAWLLALAGVANAEVLGRGGNQKPGQWRWELGGVYRTWDGHGAVVERQIRDLENPGRVLFEVTIIETPINARWKHSAKFIVEGWQKPGDFWPAYLCFTQPRFYVSEDGMSGGWEADRYTSFEPCPAVPVS